MDAREFLPPQLQNLFELSYFSDPNDNSIIPTGWNSVDDNKSYTRISTRAPEEASPVDQDTPGNWTNGAASDDESESEDASQATAQTRMADESDDEDEPVHVTKVRPL